MLRWRIISEAETRVDTHIHNLHIVDAFQVHVYIVKPFLACIYHTSTLYLENENKKLELFLELY